MAIVEIDARAALRRLLAERELDFHKESSSYSTHALHAFAAKFPPQLPRLFIRELTTPGETVLDPMMGSGTALVEAALLGRRAVGVDIDPLALLICRVKTTPLSPLDASQAAHDAVAQATGYLRDASAIASFLGSFDSKTRAFIDYWIAEETQRELAALMLAINQQEDSQLKSFLLLAFSSIIVTKSGGVSLARDLAHSRPHKDATKVPKSAMEQFRLRAAKTVRALEASSAMPGTVAVEALPGDCRQLPIESETVDLIVTSPPYANAIDYMRAHKFTLVWLGEPIDSLTERRSVYVGAERIRRDDRDALLPFVADTVRSLGERDPRKAGVLAQYFADMRDALREMARVLRPGRAAIVVVGPSTMRGLRIDAARCLGVIGERIGLDLVGIADRKLDRDRRMMPARTENNGRTLIEHRIHDEQVIGFIKP
ncbi:MAG: hypothetical protein HY691_06885 [Chloroflexi bacterium]|nr:hypothetical protein [Chloroflexota bacterium]